MEHSKFNHNLKKGIVLCLIELTEGEEEEQKDDSSDWIKAVNRGGLNQVSDMMYMVVVSMELEVKKYLSLEAVEYPPDIKTTLTDCIMKNEDVAFYWAIVSANWEEEECKVLLSMIVDLWVTICGFAFTSMWMEHYKTAQKKTVQKSKGVRKTLIGSTKM